MNETKGLGNGRGDESQSGASSQTVEAVQQRAEVAVDEMSNVAQSVQDEVRGFADATKSEVRRRVDEQGAQLGDIVRQFGSDLSTMGGGADDPDQPAARAVRQIGDRVAGAADRYQQRGIDGVVEDLKRFARRHPGQFVVGAAAAGFFVGRVIRNVDTDAIKRQVAEPHQLQGSVSAPAFELQEPDQSLPPTSPTEKTTAARPVAGVAGEELGTW